MLRRQRARRCPHLFPQLPVPCKLQKCGKQPFMKICFNHAASYRDKGLPHGWFWRTQQRAKQCDYMRPSTGAIPQRSTVLRLRLSHKAQFHGKAEQMRRAGESLQPLKASSSPANQILRACV